MIKSCFEIKTITEGELVSKLNNNNGFCHFETSTPDNVINDWFTKISIVSATNDPNCRTGLITNTNIIATTSIEYVIDTFGLKGAIMGLLKKIFLEINFVNIFVGMIIDASISHDGKVGERIHQIHKMMKHVFFSGSVTMFENIVNIDWDNISMMYFFAINSDISPDELNFDTYQSSFEIKSNFVDWMINRDYEYLYNIAKNNNFTDLMVLLMKWKNEYELKNNKEEIGL